MEIKSNPTSPGPDPAEVVSITLTRREWKALVGSLRGEGLNLQLGRLPWMTVAHIEGKIGERPPTSSKIVEE